MEKPGGVRNHEQGGGREQERWSVSVYRDFHPLILPRLGISLSAQLGHVKNFEPLYC